MRDVITLRPCTVADAATLALIGGATLLEAFAGFIPGDSLLAHCAKHHVPAAYISHFNHPATRAWLAEIAPAAAPIGYALLTAPDFPPELLQPDDLELRRIYVFSRFHGPAGPSRKLLDAVLTQARQQQASRLLLGVHPDNHRALAFYHRNGFQQIGTRTFHVGALTFTDPVLALTL